MSAVWLALWLKPSHQFLVACVNYVTQWSRFEQPVFLGYWRRLSSYGTDALQQIDYSPNDLIEIDPELGLTLLARLVGVLSKIAHFAHNTIIVFRHCPHRENVPIHHQPARYRISDRLIGESTANAGQTSIGDRRASRDRVLVGPGEPLTAGRQVDPRQRGRADR
jgi:hypothetical protein